MTRYVYVGTYTQSGPGGPSRPEGIYIFRMDSTSGEMTRLAAVDAHPNPSYLAIHPNRRFLYAANELGEGEASALSIDPLSGKLTYLNSQPAHGSAPCYVSLDPHGKWLLAANYGSGNLAVFPVGEDGRLAPASDLFQHAGQGPDPRRQEKAHAHSVLFDPAGRFVLSADLGLDQVLVYRFDDQDGRLIPNDPPGVSLAPGAGPRHLAFHPNGRFLYVANELDSTVTVLSWDGERGALQPVQTLTTLPEGWSAKSYVADIHLAPSGRYLYVSNRGHNSLAIFAVNEWTGTLFPDGHVSTGGDFPRNFALDPFGTFVLAANQNSGTIVTFRLEPVSGQLTNTRQITTVPSPVCIKILDL